MKKYTKEEQIATDVLEDLAREFAVKSCDCSPDKLTIVDVMETAEGEIITHRCVECGSEVVHKLRIDESYIMRGVSLKNKHEV